MQTIYIDISHKSLVSPIYAKQNDVGRKFAIVFYDNSAPYYLDGKVLSAFYSGDSGSGNYTEIDEKSAFTVSGNIVTVELIPNMLANAGDGLLCIVINDVGTSQISSWNIPYVTEAIPGADSDAATDYYVAFVDTLESLTPIYLTQEEYDALEEAGELLAGREYRILEG